MKQVKVKGRKLLLGQILNQKKVKRAIMMSYKVEFEINIIIVLEMETVI